MQLSADQGSALPLRDLFGSWRNGNTVVLAVSGGPDSIALMHLAARWRDRNSGPSLFVATVDHALRPGSADDAAFVLVEAEKLGLPGACLRWDGPKPSRAIQERARDARYDLLCAYALQCDAEAIATAHTLDDQAETLLFRMARGSGPRGLAGMAQWRQRNGIAHWRPLLGTSKADLLKLCRETGWPYRDDPSNASTRFARVRWRTLMPQLAQEGLDAPRLGQFAIRMARAEAAIESCVERVWDAVAEIEVGTVHLAYGALAHEPAEIALRVVERALVLIGGPRPRLERLERLMRELASAWGAKLSLRRTLHDTLVELGRDGRLTVRSEEGTRRSSMKSRQACGSEVGSVPLASPKLQHTLPSDAVRPAGCMPRDALPTT